MPTLRATLGFLLLATSAVSAQSNPDPLVGAWRRVESFGPNTPWHRTQPGERIFVDGHFSWISVQTPFGAPRPATPGPDGTAEQLRAVWGPFQAQAGTYQVSGDTIIQQVIVAKTPAAMAPGNAGRFTYRMVSDSLWITNLGDRSTGKYVRLRGVDQGEMRGVWRQLETRAADGTLNNTQPGFRLFADGHYHLVRALGTSPRPPLGPDATAAELRAVWGTGFAAEGGTYGMAGDIVINAPVVSKVPEVMTPGRFNTFRIRMVGDTLVHTQHGSQAGPIANPNTGRYVKVRSGTRPPTN
jgi:hypothetical protein